MLQCPEPNTSEPLTNEKTELSSNRDPPPTKKLPINSLRHFYLHISHALYRNISSEQLLQHSSASPCSQHLEVRKLVSPHYPVSAACINLLLPRRHLKGKKKKKQYLSTGSFTWQWNIKEEMANTLQLLQEEPGCLEKTCATLNFLSQNRSLPSISSHHHLAGSVSISPRYLTTLWRTFTHAGKSFSFPRISRQPKYQIYRQSWQPALALVDRNQISFWTFFF